MRRTFQFDENTPPLCRLGLATRGNTHLSPADVRYAVERGVNYLNWCGRPDGLSSAVAGMGAEREEIVLAWQLKSRTASGAERELDDALRELNTDYIDVVTFYYVEREGEWCEIASERRCIPSYGSRPRAGEGALSGPYQPSAQYGGSHCYG